MDCRCAICKNEKDFKLNHDIIEAARKGKLVLFVGSGVSTESKGIFPKSFYEVIRDEMGIEEDITFSGLMERYCNKPNGRIKLLEQLKRRFNYIDDFPEIYGRVTRFHRELSTIACIKEIITTNWDDYFERECNCVPFVTSQDFALSGICDRRVYKIHGSINNLGSIVATESDYKACYNKLQKNIIGSKLKLLLSEADKTVVFIGYSLYDEDFIRIWNYLQKEMKDFMPHYYVVTLDEHIEDRLDNRNIIPIITDGTFFLHKLKNELIAEGSLITDDIYGYAEFLCDITLEKHSEVEERLQDFPDLIYTLMYQDGLIHSFQRAYSKKRDGYYSDKHKICASIRGYYELYNKYAEYDRVFDCAYIQGYLVGLQALMDYTTEQKPSIPSQYFIFDDEDKLWTMDQYIEIRDKYLKNYPELLDRAKELIVDGLAVHHPPYL
ncbi:SIR2-like protein [Natranaerovirga hydrolytica]|uniref:SIR2-like protein n=1 Tax=Natranaerovirga hydrolytica TaxID=680378 RepID=A0A4R1MXM1_9FIRM|nr:SIR2 family protein [Natranaerovirga hydrolytica]TCK98018.1 SIR2-like protein [Natranaerovirga hydrolytica]